MLKIIYDIDDGIDFGKWKDKTSQYLYYQSTIEILKKIKIPDSVADFGGGNGLLKQFIPQIKTIDIDENKQPDLIANILHHHDHYELIIIRYVLHYLNDYEVIELFKTINADNILIIQFENQDLKIKYQNSINEFKYFRTTNQLKALIPKKAKEIYSKEYMVDSTFYDNRLKNGQYEPHREILKAYYV